MKVIGQGSQYMIFDDSMKLYENLPAQIYSVRFSKHTGFFLEKHADIEIAEEKIYGVHMSKIDKVMKAFSITPRNLGVIMSGAKGIGKSLFAKLLAQRAQESGIPVLIVDGYIPGIANYLESIVQEVVVMFDEFEKTFEKSESNGDPQAEMLTLFDGFSTGKKMFVITCNRVSNLNDYLVNRPGRFHYHFRFDYPTCEQVREYMVDKVAEEYRGEIEAVVDFSAKVPMNYDCLRAIAFELNMGYTFKEAAQDLNIVNTETEQYNVVAYFNNGYSLTDERAAIDMFSPSSEVELYLHGKKSRYDTVATISFLPQDARYRTDMVGFVVPGTNVTISPYDNEEDQLDEEKEAFKAGLSHIVIMRCAEKSMHYAV